MRADLGPCTMDRYESAAGDRDIGVLARRQINMRTAMDVGICVLGDELAQVGTARSRGIEGYLLDRARRGDGGAAMDSDEQQLLLQLRQIECAGAVDCP